MNPARSLGPALYNWNFESQWLYWVAPFSASLITSVTFRLVFWKKDPEEDRVVEEQPLQSKDRVEHEA